MLSPADRAELEAMRARFNEIERRYGDVRTELESIQDDSDLDVFRECDLTPMFDQELTSEPLQPVSRWRSLWKSLAKRFKRD